MRARGITAVAVALACIATVPALGAVQPGDPPALWGFSCFKAVKPCDDPLVIEAGRLPGEGRWETAGMNSSKGLCLGIATRVRGSGGAMLSCGGTGLPSRAKAMAIGVYGWNTDRARSVTQLVLSARPDATDLRLRYRKGGVAHHEDLPVAPVDGELLAGLGQPDPFGVFTANLRGCPDSKITFTAYGEAGRLDQMRLGSFRACGKSNGAGFAIFARHPRPSSGSKLLLRRTDRP